MPRGDGTGPFGQGPVTGKGVGRQGRMGGVRSGPTGNCICPKCGEKFAHTAGIPCTSLKCPKCGASMIREL